MNRFDYLLILEPSKITNAHALRGKRLVRKAIGNFDSMNSFPHLTITNFYNKPDYEIESLIPSLRRKILTLPPLHLKVDGYDYFENPKSKTIYLKPVIGQQEMIWFDQISDHVNKSEIVPHITIAKGLSDEQFETLWPMFKDDKFSDTFCIDHLTILKRETYDLESYYKSLTNLKFKNQRLMAPFIYKSRKKRTHPRGPESGFQTFLF